jgi:uncharacterized protein (DUF2126 family)
MSIQVALTHTTHYRYDREVSLSPQVVRLRPAPHARTTVLSYSLSASPSRPFINWQQDPHGNYLARLVYPEKVREFRLDVDLVADLAVINPFDFFLEPSAERFPFSYDGSLAKDLAPFLEVGAASPRLCEFLGATDRRETPTIEFLVGLNRRLSNAIKYLIRLEPGVQSPEETLACGSGSCRDTGWLLVQILRQLGLAARFVSGYLIQLVPDVKSLEGPAGPLNDFTDLHAWAEVYLPGAGWIGLDPTSGLLAGEGHIPLAATPDPHGAAPVTGTVDPCETTFIHEMRVQRVAESPRVTKPYTEEQWGFIESLGHRVDADLVSADVRLTMGGEPTFVSIDDMDGAEWNTAALGEKKRELAGALVRRLKKRFAPGGLLHFGQGKWYPGEPLPRWALGCWWRRDGEPIWTDDRLIADEAVDYRHDANDARRFIEHLAGVLGVSRTHVIPAYEDAWYYLWRERRLPVNVDPVAGKLDDPLERARLARLFDAGLGAVVGYVLPLDRFAAPSDPAVRQWTSTDWPVRSSHLFLIPGDSPIGYRLPLDSLPWLDPEVRRGFEPRDPHAAVPLLQSYRDRSPRASEPVPVPVPVPVPLARTIRTALCVEPRGGRLYVFIPPMASTEDYLDLIAAIECAAAGLALPIVIEGERPPSDPGLNHLSVTPDPGVIEVNLQPAHSWDDLVRHTTALYEEARLVRLGAEKFMLDGRHTGTGGGNHIVLGGGTAPDSPILRRPDLLRSLVGYWHNHPSMSYLFSGLFIGPTSQHPRVDEARDESLHELEIAFKEIPEGGPVQPWLVDRVFRHLLTDVTGNTHRAEFCIDKLYAPDSSSGRQGLVEMRAFEMPPHARMSLTQQLLLRALVAMFWNEPYRRRLVRWGTELHDRFMLPHFVAQDFGDVIDDLRTFGYPLQAEWFAPHLEFRFPRCGNIVCGGVALEIRQALEPWPVLGEEPGGGGTVRQVDSSIERVQVKVRGLTGSRHVITCNGRRVPLHPTETAGEHVGGVRYRAWRPPSCLHPTVGVHAPLVFDVVDTWSERSLGGCVYHVSHPGGRNFDTFPVNAYEAESRRLARFFAIGHTPGVIRVPAETRDPEFPMTLDLRAASETARLT